MSTPLNVLLYNGSGVSAASRDFALANLRSFLAHRYDVQLVSPKSLREEPWTDTCALLVFPGGRDLPYQYDLEGKANRRIREWVESGGRYLGFCAGAYYASKRVEFEVGTELEVVGDRELGFFPGTCSGTAFPGFAYETEAGAREVVVELNRTAWRDHWSQSPESAAVWYNGGGAFVMDPERSYPNVEVLAMYGQLPSRPAAGVRCEVGRGRAVLWAVHPEHPTFLSPSPSPIDGASIDTFEVKEQRRQGLLRATLGMLDLDVSDVPAPLPQLLPLFLTSPDLSLVNKTAQAIASYGKNNGAGAIHLADRHDQFFLYPATAATRLLAEAHAQPGSSDADVLHAAPKYIAACNTAVPSTDFTPLFDLPSYFRELDIATGDTAPVFGNVLLYGEAVTSTQTMLDKCVAALVPFRRTLS